MILQYSGKSPLKIQLDKYTYDLEVSKTPDKLRHLRTDRFCMCRMVLLRTKKGRITTISDKSTHRHQEAIK